MERTERKELIRTIYLYLFSLVGLVLIVIGMVRLVNLGLRVAVFKNADRVVSYPVYPRSALKELPTEAEIERLSEEEQALFEEKQIVAEKENVARNRERTASDSLAMIIVGTPLFLYHWRTIQKNKKS